MMTKSQRRLHQPKTLPATANAVVLASRKILIEK
jgi:hypothetical protein